MGWARFDDNYSDHPKVEEAGYLAELIDVRAIIHCARYELDGLLPRSAIPRVTRGMPRGAKAAIARLVEVGRWHESGHDCAECAQPSVKQYVVHDFLKFNPSHAEREEERRKARERMAKSRSGGSSGRTSGGSSGAPAWGSGNQSGEGADSAPNACETCGGTGWIISTDTDERVSTRCDCQRPDLRVVGE